MPTCPNCGGDTHSRGCHHENNRGAGGHQNIIPKPNEESDEGGF